MNRFKNIAFSALLAIGAFSLVTYTSCTKEDDYIDPCASVLCQNNGTCSNGLCTCPTGYEGPTCGTKTRDKFVGTWQGQDICTSNTYAITLTIGASSASEISALVNNPGGFGTPVTITGIVTGTNTLSFTNANVTGGRTLTGTMTFTGGTSTTLPTAMQFSYTVTPTSGSADVCNGTYTKL